MRRLPIIYLETGMIAAQDIKYQDCIIIPKDTKLTPRHIEKLGLFNIPDIPVYTKHGTILKSLPDEWIIYEEAHHTIKNFFETIKLNQPLHMEMIDQTIDDIIASVSENENAFLQLNALKTKDNYTYFHSINVCILAVIMGKNLRLSSQDTHQLALSGLLHDTGKCLIPDSILLKPDKLTAAEFEQIKRHTINGAAILQERGCFSDGVILTALEHHERWDGTGYPEGKKSEQTHRFSRIISLVDTYDALTSERVYKPPEPQYAAGEYILSLAGYAYDPDLVKIFLNAVSMYPLHSLVRLSSGEIGTVSYIPPDIPWRPKIHILPPAPTASGDGSYEVDLLKDRSLFIQEILKD